MDIWTTDPAKDAPILEFDSRGAFASELAAGEGEAHVYRLRFEPGGCIRRHVAGFDQLLLVLEGEGWAEGEDGHRRPLRPGEIAHFLRGETHAKGSDSGMTALMIQVDTLRSVSLDR